jgi:hypothetical protein
MAKGLPRSPAIQTIQKTRAAKSERNSRGGNLSGAEMLRVCRLIEGNSRIPASGGTS